MKALSALFAITLLFASGAEAQGVSDTEILIGQSAALSGPAKDQGEAMRAGAALYFDRINKSGGVNGRKIVLKSLDDAGDAKRAAENTKKLVGEDKVFALFGYTGTLTSNAAIPIFSKEGVPFVAAASGADSLRAPYNPLVFHVRASYSDELQRIMTHLAGAKVERVAALYQYGTVGLAGLYVVERELHKNKMRLLARASVERGSVDVGNAVRSIAAQKPQAVIMITDDKSSAAFIRDMKKAGANPIFWSVSLVGGTGFAKMLGEKDSRGVQVSQVVPLPWDVSLPIVMEYRAAAEAAGVEPVFGSLEGYIAAKVMAEGIKRAGKKLSRDGFIRALESAPYDAGGYRVAYGPGNHHGSQFVDLTIIGRDLKFTR